MRHIDFYIHVPHNLSYWLKNYLEKPADNRSPNDLTKSKMVKDPKYYQANHDIGKATASATTATKEIPQCSEEYNPTHDAHTNLPPFGLVQE